MEKYPDDANIWGFTFTDKIEDLRIDDIHETLFDRDVNLKDVIFSSWFSDVDDCIWIVAADRFLNENEIKDTIDYIIENQLENKFFIR